MYQRDLSIDQKSVYQDTVPLFYLLLVIGDMHWAASQHKKAPFS